MNKPKYQVWAVRAHFIDGTCGDCIHFDDEADAYEHRRQMLEMATLQNSGTHAARLLGVANVTVHPIAIW